MNDTTPSGFTNVIQKINSICLDQRSYKRHQVHGTLDRHYNELLQDMIADVLKVSVIQIEDGISPLNSSVLVANTFTEVAKIVGITFGRQHSEVAADIVSTLETFPTEDYRSAVLLRKQNKLH